MLTFIQATPPDLILLDWELPGLSEVNLLPALRACCPELLVIAQTNSPLAGGEEGTVGEAAQAMLAYKISDLPVIDEQG